MPHQEFQENWKLFSDLINDLTAHPNKELAVLIKRYIEQNILFLNDVFASSIENLNRLEQAKNATDVICIQARFSNELNKRLTLSTQRFLNASLGHIADYNDWLKAHCDLATD